MLNWPHGEEKKNSSFRCLNAYELTRNEEWLDKAGNCWKYISEHLIDRSGGEWFWSISDEGIANREGDKAGFWKCPYHNSRMCLEIMMMAEK